MDEMQQNGWEMEFRILWVCLCDAARYADQGESRERRLLGPWGLKEFSYVFKASNSLGNMCATLESDFFREWLDS